MVSIEARIDCAERLLFELAAELRFVPVEERTRRLHLRALELKREVRSWRTQPPELAACDALCDEVQSLADEARRVQAERHSSLPRASVWLRSLL